MTKTKFVEDLSPGSVFVDVFLVQAFDKRTAKNGKQYATLSLRDRTGDVPARIWTERVGEDILDISRGSFLKVEARPELYRDEIQLTLVKYRVIEESEIQLEDFVPASKFDRDVLFEQLQNRIAAVRHPDIQHYLFGVTELYAVELRDCPAAKSKHQPYLGGLLEHVLSLVRNVDSAVDNYPGLDRDVLVAACIVHDIGKVQELTWRREIAYSPRGSLVGHVLQSFDILRASASGRVLQAPWFLHLEHIVASHHGQRAWGAARVPASREAWVFHLADYLDARMGLFDSIEDLARDEHGFTKFIPDLEGAAYFPPTRSYDHTVPVQQPAEPDRSCSPGLGHKVDEETRPESWI